ncbi:MAG: hypothetical protein HZB18_07325 [Chloroflexi bacterium]|nr:hypothetical protein [Chloroflexota bacterium]
MPNQKEITYRNNIHEPIKVGKDDIEKRDILERRHLAGRILNRLEEEDCPSVLGIYGGWGTGKTSLVNLLVNYNNRREKSTLYIVKIDAWKYESGESLLIPIVVELKNLVGNLGVKVNWKSITRRVFAGAALTVADELLKKTFLDRKRLIDNIEEATEKDKANAHEAVMKEWVADAKEIEETEEGFRQIVGLAAKQLNKDKIVLCIDNLDRCSPDNVVRLLESVKLFFNDSQNCAWLFAIDSDVIASYISRKYDGTSIDGYSYLDKIIPEQYHLSLSPTSDERIIASLLRYASGGDAQHQINISKIPQIPKILVPRRLIKSAKKFSDYYKNGQASQGVSPEMVMALSMLYHSWPDFYQRLSSASKEHIKGILENFFQRDPKKPVEARAKNVNIPLDEKFLQDRELVYFLQTVFAGYNSNSSERYVIDIVNGLKGLREGGLP